MVLIRRSLDLLVRALARLPRWFAVIVGIVAIPLWAVTLGLGGLMHEAVVKLDEARVRRSPTAKPAGRPMRLATTGLACVVVLAAASNLTGASTARAETGQAVGASAPTASPQPTLEPTPTSTPIATPRPTPRGTLTPRPTFGPTGPTVEARVLRVVDGDTIEVDIAGASYNVRYIGMDTPETVDPGSPVEWMGPEAATVNAELVNGKTVVLETDVSETDQYGRLLRYVWLTETVPWTLVNVELVRRGVASLDTWPPDVKYVELIRAAEHSARGTSAGLWGATPPPTRAPTPVRTLVPFVAPPPEPASDCHPSYDPCLPIVGDLNCPDVRGLGAAPVRVKGSDDYALDRDGDGIGCE
jgi:micrococcal nuclease